jgi:hypothetical protein
MIAKIMDSSQKSPKQIANKMIYSKVYLTERAALITIARFGRISCFRAALEKSIITVRYRIRDLR